MNLLAYILLFNFLGSVISLVGGILLFLKKDIAHKYSHLLSSYAAGVLLGTAMFDLLPEAVEESHLIGDAGSVFFYAMIGILFFFLLERFLHWFHHHGYEDHAITKGPIVTLIIVGDTIHNFIDGVAIAATFMISVPLGIITTFAVGAHEIPQEIGDFGLLLKNGLSKKRVIIINVVSAMASFLGALLAFYFGSSIQGLSVIFLSLASGFFLYIALSDLIPEIHHENKKGLAIWETVSLLSGVFTIFIALFIIKEVLHISA